MTFTARMALAAILLAAPAQAQEEALERDVRPGTVIDTNLFCDTQEQIRSFMTHLNQSNGNAEAALDAVNAEPHRHLVPARALERRNDLLQDGIDGIGCDQRKFGRLCRDGGA